MDIQHDDGTAAQRIAAAVYIAKYAKGFRAILLDGPQHSAAPLDQALDALGCGGDPARVDAAIAELHNALRAAGDPVGINAATRDFTIARSGGARPDETVYLCPTGACSRVWWPQPGEAVPHCATGNTELRRERL
ncbi:hypothetical protein [Yinghuangia soli]|uniref:Uncharacterized protein n=1 Tax=Yinghuangia soli TaxID=2908204 RepID=A0AA41PU22_9ACTN|nr:hypothetical protein [Yinghuangia soli]MCF2525878.1 hypothetical protein [Yinghuangia soli]